MGYIPLGMAYGLLAAHNGISWEVATLMSVVIFAGAGQFLTVALFAAGASLSTVFIAVFLLNLRHFFYGLSLIGEFKVLKGIKKQYAIFCLTDETFAVLKTLPVAPEDREKAFWTIAGLDHLYWIVGGFLGAFLGEHWQFNTHGIEFCLTALFVVLGMELYKQDPARKPLLLSLIIGAFGMLVFPGQHMLVLSLLLCAVSLFVFRRWMERA
ncbi:MAG: AzlC family ABC transporter permease [Zoogloeaceae bacterium]|nr:AzlC family ABC transporter permease [Zoogloeaceae bacterium]